MDTPKTRRELIDQIIDNLGVLVFGQTPSDEQVSKVDGTLDPLLAMLAAQDVVYVADAGTPNPPTGGEIDQSIFLPLADCGAWAVASKFNLADDPALKVLDTQARENLKQIGRPAPARRTLRIDAQLGSRRRAVLGNFTRGT